MLRPEAHRVAVLLAVVEEIPLVPLQHGPRDLQRLGQPALVAPPDERDQMERAVADRVLGVVLDGEGLHVLAQHDLQQRLRLGLARRGGAGHYLPLP